LIYGFTLAELNVGKPIKVGLRQEMVLADLIHEQASGLDTGNTGQAEWGQAVAFILPVEAPFRPKSTMKHCPHRASPPNARISTQPRQVIAHLVDGIAAQLCDAVFLIPGVGLFAPYQG
jgi:hypothetical protein